MEQVFVMNNSSIKLLCIPYAGSSAYNYNKWSTYFDHSVTVYPLDLAGRGMRCDEDYYENMNNAIDDLYEKTMNVIGNSEYVLFGHSMGALLAYELCNRLENSKVKQPKHLIISGYPAPQLPQDDLDKDIKEIVQELGGMPEEIWSNPYLYDVFMPILQADYRLLRSYRYPLDRMPLNTDISILYGEKDIKTPLEKVISWRGLTKGSFDYHLFKGGHFFINEHTEEVIDCIKRILIMGEV